MDKKRILTGLQPTGAVHLGNYFGSIRQMVHLQDEGKMFFFIADLHALTNIHSDQERCTTAQREENSKHLLCASVALGIDPKKAIIYRQSDFPQTTEMMWMFACALKQNFLTIGHAYKDAVQQNRETGLGVFLYPVLMAADILITGADIVPVGRDQAQHVEIAREIARKLNHIAGGSYFTEPQAQVQEEYAVIPGSDGEKMSKSKGNTLPIFEEEEILRKKIMTIVTDSTPKGEPIDPKTCLLSVYLEKIMPQREYKEVENRCNKGSITYKELKDLLAEQYLAYFKDARESYNNIIEDEKYLNKVLKSNRKHLDTLFTERLNEVKKGIGI